MAQDSKDSNLASEIKNGINSEINTIGRELADEKEIEKELSIILDNNHSMLTRSVFLVKFHTAFTNDESQFNKIHRKILTLLEDWKGDLDAELKSSFGDNSGEENLKKLYQEILSDERAFNRHLDETANISPALHVLFAKSKFTHEDIESIASLSSKLKNSLAHSLEFEKKISEKIEKLNNLIREYNVKSYQLQSYKDVNGSTVAGIVDLLKGTGKYSKYSPRDRLNLWNRWVRSQNREKKFLADADLSNANLDGFDFTGFTFKNVNFTGASVEETNFTRVVCVGEVDFSKIYAKYTDFSDAILIGANFAEASLRGVMMTNANLSNANLMVFDCEGTNFDGAIFNHNTKFKNVIGSRGSISMSIHGGKGIKFVD